jgi:hypothetical protein
MLPLTFRASTRALIIVTVLTAVGVPCTRLYWNAIAASEAATAQASVSLTSLAERSLENALADKRVNLEAWAHIEHLAPGLHERRNSSLLKAGAADPEVSVLADASGRVVSASKPSLLGQDVGETHWFRSGEINPATLIMSDVAVSEADDSSRLAHVQTGIYLAQPVKDRDGQMIGVAGLHLPLEWLQDFLLQQSQDLGLDLYIVDQTGSTLTTSSPHNKITLSAALMTAAELGLPANSFEVEIDRKTSFVSLSASTISTHPMAQKWRLAGRLAVNEHYPYSSILSKELIPTAILLIGTIALLFLTYEYVVISPLMAVIACAVRISEGSLEYPLEGGEIVESVSLATAITKLQLSSTLGGVPPGWRLQRTKAYTHALASRSKEVANLPAKPIYQISYSSENAVSHDIQA